MMLLNVGAYDKLDNDRNFWNAHSPGMHIQKQTHATSMVIVAALIPALLFTSALLPTHNIHLPCMHHIE